MVVRHAWLLVALPAAASFVAAGVHVLLTVGESREVGRPALCGAGLGLLLALGLTFRPNGGARTDRRPLSSPPASRPRP